MDNVLELLRNSGIQARKVSAGRHGDEYHSACPVCGDGGRRSAASGPSDRFQVWPTRREGGYFRCRRCGISGDNIQFLRSVERKSYPEACAALGIELPNTYVKPAKMTPRPPKASVQTFHPHVYDLPDAAWLEKAAEFALLCHEDLMKSEPALKWLAARGITRDSALKYHLGYNVGKDGGLLYKSRQSWGLPKETAEKGRDKPLWLPAGLVIPLKEGDGRVVQLRIRRTAADRKQFLPELKYYVVPGGSQATMVLNRGARCFVSVEAGLDAILVAQEAEGLDTGAVTTWNATAKPDAATCELLEKCTRILVALDADAAGDKGSEWWIQVFRNARRHAPRGGKDPGDAFAAGGNIREWLLAGLPPAITLFAGKEAPVSTSPAPPDKKEDAAVTSPGTVEIPGTVKDLGKLLQAYPVRIISTRTRLGIEKKQSWHNDKAFGRISSLVFFDKDVMAFLHAHPKEVITGGNFFDGIASGYQQKQPVGAV